MLVVAKSANVEEPLFLNSLKINSTTIHRLKSKNDLTRARDYNFFKQFLTEKYQIEDLENSEAVQLINKSNLKQNQKKHKRYKI